VNKTDVEYLARIEELLTVLAKAALSQTMREELADKDLRRLYDLTGSRSVKDISAKTGFSTGKISGLWQRWEERGLLIKDGAQYRKVI
jgi:hypothetical protein